MSVEQPPTGRARSPARDAKLVRYDEYIDAQIASTRRLVKAVDITTVLVTLAVGVIAFLFVAAVVEHWLLASGFGLLARTILFVALVGGVGYYSVRRLWPLVAQSINPAYAAYTIEQGSPTLKNSLLNLLLFRQHRDELTDAVYETLEEQAAQRLAQAKADAAVDRTHLVRLGYVLMAVVALAALYKVLSPKDPLVTARRVLMPWADIVPASRVTISNVEPGATTLARGEVLEVSAEVRGIGEDDPVVVRYTTADGQAVDRAVPLAPSAAGLRYHGKIPDGSTDDAVGVTQNLRYRIEAGDARSREYAVTVVAAPTIVVERIDYDYPDYTGYADHTVSGLGDIRAIEGTRVTIHARANEPIQEAAVDFEADGRRDLVMIVDDLRAQTPVVLTLRDDRMTPKFTSYVLRFNTLDGRSNRDPVKHSIDIVPDYRPEVRILAPSERVRDVRVDETIAIEVEARDPDFALADVRIQGDVAGRTVLDHRLLRDEHVGRYAGRLQFTPRDYGLRPGDTMRFWAVAADNRTPEPNQATSDSQTLRIVAPDPNRRPPPDRVAQRDQRREPPQDGAQQQPQQNGEAGGENAAGGAEGQASEEQSSEGQASEGKPDGTRGGTPSDDGNQPGSRGDAPQDANPDPQQGRGQQSGDSGHGSSTGDQRGEPSDDAASRPTEETSGGQPGEGGRAGSQATDRAQRSEDASDRQPADGAKRDTTDGREARPGEQSPVSPDGDNDAEAFERIRKFLERQKQNQANGPSQETGDEDARGEHARDQDAGARDAGESASADGDQRRDDRRGAERPGAQTRPGDPSQPEQSRQAERDRSDSQSPGGEQTSSKGPAGAGDQPRPEQGAPDSQPEMKPADKRQTGSDGQQRPDDQEPPAGGRGKRESDSQGEQGGDRAGGGQEGGGQRAEREGTGSAGQNQSADEGGGESSQQGAGRDSNNAGRDATADGRTGERGSDQRGEGSARRDGPAQERGGNAGGEDAPARDQGPGAPAEGESASADGRDRTRSNRDRESQGETGDAAAGPATDGGAGRTPQGAGPASADNGEAPEADAANLEYAREQTDLVLETLAEQLRRRRLDKRLLDELGWTPEDMQRFLDRWQQLRESARGNTPAAESARRELDEALRSLGLRRGPLQQGPVRDDDLRDLREGYRGAVPLEYQQRLRAYNEGISRARQSEP